MPSSRKGSAVKTLSERSQYLQTVESPQNSQSSTYEESLVPVDTTDSPPQEEATKNNDYQPSNIKPESQMSRFFREKWAETLIGILLIAIFLQMYSLNREVGELKIKLEQKEKEFERMSKDSEKIEERIQKEIDRINQKLDQNSPSVKLSK